MCRVGILTCECLLDIYHLPRTRLHEPTPFSPRPLQTLWTPHLPCTLQITLVPRDNPDRRHLAVINASLLFHVYHLHKIVERIERGGLCDVVDKKESVGFEVRGGPERAVFFLAGRIGEHEEVALAVDVAGYGVGVLCGRTLCQLRFQMVVDSTVIEVCISFIPNVVTEVAYLSWDHICTIHVSSTLHAQLCTDHSLMCPLTAHQPQGNRRFACIPSSVPALHLNSAEISRTASSIPAHRDRDSIVYVHCENSSVAVFFLPEDKEAVVAIARSQ